MTRTHGIGAAVLALAALAALSGSVLGFPRAPARAEAQERPAAAERRDTTVRISAGPRRGASFRLAEALAELTRADGEDLLEVEAVETAGGVTGLHRLARGECDAAIVPADALAAAVSGEPPFPAPLRALRALCALYGEVVHIVARKELSIRAISDLRGRRIVLGGPSGGSTGTAAALLEAHGLGATSYERELASPEDALVRLKNGQVDAIVALGPAPLPLVVEALAAGAELVPIGRMQTDALVAKRPYLARDVIPAGTYGAGQAALDVARLDALLAVREDMRAEVAYELLSTIFDHGTGPDGGGARFARLREAVPALRPLGARQQELDAVSLHPGAMAFLGEREVFPRPVEVSVGIYTNSIFNLDVSAGAFDIDFYVWFRYRGRLDADPKDFRFELMNGEVRQRDPPVIERFGGFTYLSYKILGRFRTSFPLHRYPFDAQRLPIVIEHPQYEADQLVFRPDDTVRGKPRDLLSTLVEPGASVGEWHVAGVRQQADEHVYRTDMGSPVALEGQHQRYSRYRYELELRRDLVAYLVKFCVPLGLIVLMGFLVFFIPPEEFQVQVIVGIAALLACVAFHTTQADNLPRVGYLVTADQFFIVSYAVILLTIVQVVVEHSIFVLGMKDEARRLDRIARWVYPLLFFGLLGIVIARAVL